MTMEPRVHDGLHVMDGSIIPKALGINPLLTIAALSWRAADHLRSIAALEARGPTARSIRC